MDFYVLPGTEERARSRFACRLIEQAYLAGQRIFVWLDDTAQLERFDELLWTFADRSFVPHEIYAAPQQWLETPVLLGSSSEPQQPYDLLVNLGRTIPACAAYAARVAELVDAEDERRRAGRLRFRQYRDAGQEPETHMVAAEQAL